MRDFDRPLNERGMKDAPAMGRFLAGFDWRMESLLSSPALRAQTTARALREELPAPLPPLELLPELYGAESARMLRVLKALPEDCSCVGLVAHNPGITDFLNGLCSERIGNVPTCGMAVIHLEIGQWNEIRPGSGSLELFQVPREL